MQTIKWQNLTEQQKKNALMRPAIMNSTEISDSVAIIVNDVRENGDMALRVLTEKFDKIEIDTLQLTDEEIENACVRVSDSIKASVQLAITNIQKFHQAQQMPAVSVQIMPGILCQQLVRPIQAVGLYIPGGTAPLLSTVMMLAIPAEIAGCEQIVLCSPPPIADEIIYTAKACGVTQIFQVGGAQAVAAMAFGTESIPKVDKIFGPGNAYVTEAKKQVSLINGGAAMDMPAGPSEVLVIADEAANPAFIAADLLSQAEHGGDSQVILVTPSQPLADAVAKEIDLQLLKLPRQAIATQALAESRLIVVENLDECVVLSNQYGPEHLIIQTQNCDELVDQINSAGSIFIGQWSPESAGDYASGTNHVLPTYGYTATYSSLGLQDFQKRMTAQKLSAEGLLSIAATVEELAAAEQLMAHKEAVSIRVKELEGKK